MKRKVIIFSGPTATGKTSLSIEAALLLQNSFIVNFDSLAFYKELSIGSARVQKEEMRGVDHYLVGSESIKEPVDAYQFTLLAENIIHQRSTDPFILVGGSGFYIRALLKGMYETPNTSDELRNEMDTLYKNEGIKPFIEFLQVNDPESLNTLHPNDHYRLIRAVEYFKTSGQKISESKKSMDQEDPFDFTQNRFPDWDILHIYLDIPKDEHFKMIQKRTQSMIDNGLVKELQDLLDRGFNGKERPLQSIGYKETQDFLNGELKSLEDLKERISISTRQLAKAQRTFFKKVKGRLQFNPLEDKSKILEAVKNFIA